MTTSALFDGLHRRYIDPVTGDLAIENGRSKTDPSLATTIALLLRLERGSCAWAPELGSRIHAIRLATRQNAVLARAYAIEALQPLRRQGRLPKLEVEAEFRGPTLFVVVGWSSRDGRRVDPVIFSRRIGV